MSIVHGRTGRLTAKNGGSRPGQSGRGLRGAAGGGEAGAGVVGGLGRADGRADGGGLATVRSALNSRAL